LGGLCLSDFGVSQYPEHGKGEIYAINVLTDYQRYGAGKLLLCHALQQLRQKKMMPYFVKTLENNLPAQKFYEAMGFHATGSLVSRIGAIDYKAIVHKAFPNYLFFERGNLYSNDEA